MILESIQLYELRKVMWEQNFPGSASGKEPAC